MGEHTPQLEDGFVRFSTEWLEEFIKADYPGAVKEFVLVIARETWGWNTTWREIPAPRIAELLGVTVARVKQLRDHAVGRNLVEWQPGRGPGECGKYRVQKDYGDWIPQRVSGKWQDRYGEQPSKHVLAGKDVLSGNDVLSATGKDVLSGDRQERAYPNIDKDRHSIDSTENDLLPEPAVPAGDADPLTGCQLIGNEALAPAVPAPAEPEKPKAKPVTALSEDDFSARQSELRARIPADCQSLVDAYIDAAANANKTKRVQPGRVLTLLSELADAAEEFAGANGAFKHGLQAAVAKGAVNRNYVRTAARGYVPNGLFPAEARIGAAPAPPRQLTDSERQIAAVRAKQAMEAASGN